MRAIVVGLVVGFGVSSMISIATSGPPKLYAQRFDEVDRSASQRGDLIALTGTDADGQQTFLLVEPERRVVASYQVDAKTGQIALRSVRNVRWDLEIDEYNGTEPTPEKIQALLRSR